MKSNVDIFVENENGNIYMLECPSRIVCSELKKIIKNKGVTKLNPRQFEIFFKRAIYSCE